MTTATPVEAVIPIIFNDLQTAFESDVTKDIQWRKSTLNTFYSMLKDNYEEWTNAFLQDLGGGSVRAMMEIAMVMDEITFVLANIDRWAKDRSMPLGDPTYEFRWLDKRVVRPTPKGVCLVISAWNFPIDLLFRPAINMIAAGNCCILKPSELAPAISNLAEKLVHQYLPTEAIRVVPGDVKETTCLLKLPFDHICYTGSATVGKIVMKAAAEHLTPCTLELGGKCPQFVDAGKACNLELAAQRTILAKSGNAGQWCIDVDYCLVDESIVTKFTELLVTTAKQFLGDETIQKHPGESSSNEKDHVIQIKDEQRWCNRIVNSKHTKRIQSFLEDDHGGQVLCGGLEHCDVDCNFIPFTIVLNPRGDSKLMKEEIFGPILVLKTYEAGNINQAISIMKSVNSTPLALYVYSENKTYIETILKRCASGSACVNGTTDQAFANSVPFGGVGQSGYGSYHGIAGFNEFSHLRNIMYRSTLLPIGLGIPKLAWPNANRLPEWLYPLVIKKSVTGFMPSGKWFVPTVTLTTLILSVLTAMFLH